MSGTAPRRTHRAGERLPPAHPPQPGSSDLAVSAGRVRVKHLTRLPAKVFQYENYSDHTIDSSQKVKCFTHTPSLPSTRDRGSTMSGTAARRTHRTGEKLPPPDTAQSGPSDLGVAETAPVRVKHLTRLPAIDFQC
jgi:hypothetical protein